MTTISDNNENKIRKCIIRQRTRKLKYVFPQILSKEGFICANYLKCRKIYVLIIYDQ